MSNAEIGAKLRELRGETPRNIVAEAIGVSVSALQMYENGARIPRDQTKLRIAQYYDCSVGDIFFNQQPHETCGIVTLQAEQHG